MSPLLTRISQLELDVEFLQRELDVMRQELRAHGLKLPQPNPSARTRLTPMARRAQQLRLAARARAAKRIGKGRGAVSPQAASRISSQVQRLDGES